MQKVISDWIYKLLPKHPYPELPVRFYLQDGVKNLYAVLFQGSYQWQYLGQGSRELVFDEHAFYNTTKVIKSAILNNCDVAEIKDVPIGEIFDKALNLTRDCYENRTLIDVVYNLRSNMTIVNCLDRQTQIIACNSGFSLGYIALIVVFSIVLILICLPVTNECRKSRGQDVVGARNGFFSRCCKRNKPPALDNPPVQNETTALIL